MSAGWEAVVVGLLVAGAAAWAVRALARSLKKPGGCSSCGSSGDCPLVKGPEGGSCGAGCSNPAELPGAVEAPQRRSSALH